MSAVDAAAVGGRGPKPTPENYLNCDTSVASWMFTLDHKRIGIMYLIAVMSMFFVGGALALVIRTELAFPNSTPVAEAASDAEAQLPDGAIMGPSAYNQLFTLHGAIMVFLVIIPSIPGALGNFVLPMMLGAKDVAFPRLNLCSFYLWVFGAIFMVLTLLPVPYLNQIIPGMGDGLDTGWTFYTPYSTKTNTGVTLAVLGAFILGFSSIFTGMNFMVTVHTLRPKGMGWFQMPLFVWSLYATAIIQVLATPVLAITLLLLVAERMLEVGIFDPRYGGDPVLFQHFFWFYSHPAVYIMILPGMGIISELMATFSRRHIFGYKMIAWSSVAIALFGFLVWGHHMFTSGQSALASMVFSALTFSVGIPSAIKVFNWLATMYKGSISLETPMLYALSFLFLFTIGGLTGLFLGMLSVDVHLHDTYFVVAHFHYVMVGGTMIAMLGGIHYWWPKMTGRMYSETWGAIGAGLVFFGMNLTFIPQFVMGSMGMPRRYYDYDAIFTPYHQMSTVGAFTLGVGLLLVLVYLLASLWTGKKAPANPWGAASLEWQSTSPPSHYNFDQTPAANDPYDIEHVAYIGPGEGFRYEGEKFQPSQKPAEPMVAQGH